MTGVSIKQMTIGRAYRSASGVCFVVDKLLFCPNGEIHAIAADGRAFTRDEGPYSPQGEPPLPATGDPDG